MPGLDRAVSHAARMAFRPEAGEALSARGNPAARDLVRHAFADVGGDATRARAWARAARRWPTGAQSDLLDAYDLIDVPTLLLWADEDRLHPLSIAEEALGLLPDAHLRVLPGTGFLLAYDDPVGLARELAAFCCVERRTPMASAGLDLVSRRTGAARPSASAAGVRSTRRHRADPQARRMCRSTEKFACATSRSSVLPAERAQVVEHERQVLGAGDPLR